MILPDPPEKYDAGWFRRLLNLLLLSDNQNLKRGQVIDQLLIQSPDLSVWRGTIDNAGTVTWTKQLRT